MTSLETRQTRLIFKTSDLTRDKGKLREVIVEARPRTCTIRLSGLRSSYTLEWGAVYSLAVKMAVASAAKEKRELKKGRKTNGKQRFGL